MLLLGGAIDQPTSTERTNLSTWLQTLPSVADSDRTSNFLSGGSTTAMALTLKSQGSVASFNSTMISARLDDVVNAGPGTCQAEHTSHRLRVTLSQSSTKTPPAQGLCSNSTAEMFLPACDARDTAQDNVVIGAAPSPPEVEKVSNRCSSLSEKMSIEASGFEQLVYAPSELLVGFSVMSSVPGSFKIKRFQLCHDCQLSCPFASRG